MPDKPKIISLYSGAGGLDYGFEAAGFETAVALDFDHDSCETLRKNRRWPVIERTIFDTPSQEILETANVQREEAAVVIGGPPCQPFSKSGFWVRGDSLRLNDRRADTLSAFMDVVEAALPKAFLLENVEGLAYAHKDEGLRFILDRVRAINRRARTTYRPYCDVLSAADFGVPQIRRRFFLVAARDGRPFHFSAPTHGAPDRTLPLEGCDALETYRTAWDALADVAPDPSEDVAVRGKWADLLASIPEGGNYLWHTDRGGGKPLFGWRRRYWSFLLKLAKNRPSWTIQAQPGPAIGPFHWDSRRLSMRELCRLQTFPDDVFIIGDRSSVQRQIGNAVPALLAEVLAREIHAQLLDRHPIRGRLRLLPPDRSPAPPPECVGPVPRRYSSLAGYHSAHPGTGKGHAARRRS
jgi:DNA (cytosine-5)-methyltransferase 1